MVTQTILRGLVVTAALMTAACGTTLVQIGYWDRDFARANGIPEEGPWIYGGTWRTLRWFPEKTDCGPCVPVMALVDLPLSLVADTLLLPLSVYQEVRGPSWKDAEGLEPVAPASE